MRQKGPDWLEKLHHNHQYWRELILLIEPTQNLTLLNFLNFFYDLLLRFQEYHYHHMEHDKLEVPCRIFYCWLYAQTQHEKRIHMLPILVVYSFFIHQCLKCSQHIPLNDQYRHQYWIWQEKNGFLHSQDQNILAYFNHLLTRISDMNSHIL